MGELGADGWLGSDVLIDVEDAFLWNRNDGPVGGVCHVSVIGHLQGSNVEVFLI